MFRTLTKDDMLLYRHSTQCPAAIQIFLDENSQYWRFVPMLNNQADQVEQNIAISSRDIKINQIIRSDEDIKRMIENLPLPPPNYRFSQRQYHLQYSFFQTGKDYNTFPNVHLDLYNAKIIAVRKCYHLIQQSVLIVFVSLNSA